MFDRCSRAHLELATRSSSQAIDELGWNTRPAASVFNMTPGTFSPQRDISAAAYWPKLSVDASYSRQRLSETTPTGSLFSSVGNLQLPGDKVGDRGRDRFVRDVHHVDACQGLEELHQLIGRRLNQQPKLAH